MKSHLIASFVLFFVWISSASADTVLFYRASKNGGGIAVEAIDPSTGKQVFKAPLLAVPFVTILPNRKSFVVAGLSVEQRRTDQIGDYFDVYEYDAETFTAKKQSRVLVQNPMIPITAWPPIPMAAISPNLTRLAVFVIHGGEAAVRIYSLNEGEERTITIRSAFSGSTVPLIAWTADERGLLLVDTAIGALKIYDTGTGKKLAERSLFDINKGKATGVNPAFEIVTPVTEKLSAIAYTGDLVTWSLSNLEAMKDVSRRKLWDEARNIGQPSISPNGNYIAIPTPVIGLKTSDTDNLIVVNLELGRFRYVKAEVKLKVALVLNDGETAVTASTKNEINVLNVKSGRVIKTQNIAGEIELVGLLESTEKNESSAESLLSGMSDWMRLLVLIVGVSILLAGVWLVFIRSRGEKP